MFSRTQVKYGLEVLPDRGVLATSFVWDVGRADVGSLRFAVGGLTCLTILLAAGCEWARCVSLWGFDVPHNFVSGGVQIVSLRFAVGGLTSLTLLLAAGCELAGCVSLWGA